MGRRIQILRDLERLEALGSFPDIVLQLEEELRDPGTSLPRVARIIAEDPPLAARFLSVANSASHLRRGRPTADIATAVGRLGLLETRKLVLATAIIGEFSHLGGDPEAHWIHAVAVAHTTSTLAAVSAKSISREVRGAAYAAGLLHDIGVIALTQLPGQIYQPVIAARDARGGAIFGHELERLGVGHPEVGERLARRWGLPEPIGQAIRYHHQPWEADMEHRDLVNLVHLADFICNNQGLSHRDPRPAVYDGAWVHLRLSLDHYPRIIDGVADAADRSRETWRSARSRRP